MEANLKESNYAEDEEEYVLLHLDGVGEHIDIPANAPYVLSALDTLNPALLIGDKLKLTRTQKLERIVEEFLDFNKLKRYDYSILFRHKLGLNKYRPAISGIDSLASADLRLKEAKDLVKKAPVVLKKGISKEEANPIIEKLKELGATVVLE